MTPQYKPAGYQAITPYLVTHGAAELIDFLKKAFSAVEMERHEDDKGKIMHAAVKIDDSMIEMGDANDEWGAVQCNIHFYVPDTDAVYQHALDAGATSLREPMDMPYGERSAAVKDPFENQWFIATLLKR